MTAEIELPERPTPSADGAAPEPFAAETVVEPVAPEPEAGPMDATDVLLVLLLVVGLALAFTFFRMRALIESVTHLRRELADTLIERNRLAAEFRRAQEAAEDAFRREATDLQKTNTRLDRDRAALEGANEKLRTLVWADPLTGLSNRQHFEQRLDDELRRGLRDDRPVSVLVFGMDAFQKYNHDVGHDRGDEALSEVAEMLRQAFRRAGDLASRIRGDTFAVVLPGIDQSTALRFADRMRRGVWKLAIPHTTSPVAERLTVSGGVATAAPDRLRRAYEILERAERAMEAAKRDGGDRIATHAVESTAAEATA